MGDNENKDSWLQAGIKGLVNEVGGRAKKTFGAMTGNESLEDEGQDQRDRAEAHRDVASAEADAAKARAKADAVENLQERDQDDKNDGR